MLRLHDNLSSGNGYKVRLMLTLLGTRFERIEYDIDAGATRTPAFLAMNPDGRIPLLELEDGRTLAQSNAIICYLAEGTPFLPEDRWARAQALQWMFFEQYSHEPNVATARYWVTHKLLNDDRRRALEQKMPLGYAALGVMERHLGQHEWFAGGRYSVADIALYAYTHVAGEGGFDLGRFPAVQRWIARVASHPRHIPITQG